MKLFKKIIKVSFYALILLASTHVDCINIADQFNVAGKKIKGAFDDAGTEVYKWVSKNPLAASQAAMMGLATAYATRQAYKDHGAQGAAERLLGLRYGELDSVWKQEKVTTPTSSGFAVERRKIFQAN